MSQGSNKRIFVNTIVLYGRMIVLMGISLFTTKIILRVLGVSDYGLQNAIAGVASMFAFVNLTLSAACSRFFSYELGRGDDKTLSHTFSLMLFIYLLGAVLIFIFLETIGLWYINNKLVFDDGRASAVSIFYQMTILTVLAGWFAVPYSSLIVSYENMTLYAILSIAEACLKLAATLCVMFMPSIDHLIAYGIFLFGLSLAHTGIYIVVSHVKYPVCRWNFKFDKKMFAEILKFNGWKLFGSISWTVSDCFVNLLLNSFFGPIVNAARAIAMQVSNAMVHFTQNFLTASRPQIVKLWAAEEHDQFKVLLIRVSKIGYFLMFIVALPMYAEAETVLNWWLDAVPDGAVCFLRIVLLTILVNSFSFPLIYAAQATGKIAKFTAVGSGVLLLVWPLSWICLSLGMGPSSVFWVSFSIACVALALRFLIVMSLTDISPWYFLNQVYVRMGFMSIVPIFVIALISVSYTSGIIRFFVVCLVSLISSILSFACFGLDRNERMIIMQLLATKFIK